MENENIINNFFQGVLLCATSNQQAISSYYRIYQQIYDIGATLQIWHQSKFTGSMYEGFTDKVRGDQDSMIIYNGFPNVVSYNSQDGTTPFKKENTVFVETIKENPAFVILKTMNKDLLQNINVSNSVNNKGFINGKKLVESLKFQEDVVNGPAMTSLFNKSFPNLGEQDSVPAFACNDWPSLASSFLTRNTASGWPSEELRKKIASKGCHLVAAGIPGSVNNELEWRWSFSVAELELIHHMSQSMYTSIFALKAILKKYWIHKESWPHKPICSYFLKTICLWLSEEIECNEIDIMKLLRLILDKLIKCYSEKFIPHYFIPTQNLIGHLNTEMCQYVIDWLNEIKENLFVTCLNSIDIDGKLIDIIDEFADENGIALSKCGEESSPHFDNMIEESSPFLNNTIDDGGDDYKEFFSFLKNKENVEDLISPLMDQIKTDGECYVYDQRFRLAEYATFNGDPISEAFMKYKESKETLFVVPEDVLLPVIKDIDEIVFTPYAGMYRQSLYRYLSRLYLNLSSYLLEKEDNLSRRCFEKAIEYGKLGKEMIHPDGWTDKGFVGMIQLAMCYYLNHKWNELELILNEIQPFLEKALVDVDWRNGFADIPIIMINHLRPIPWQNGDKEFYSRLIAHFYRETLLLNPITFILYVIGRNFIRKGDMTQARKSIDDLNTFINSDYSVNVENLRVAEVKIDILKQ